MCFHIKKMGEHQHQFGRYQPIEWDDWEGGYGLIYCRFFPSSLLANFLSHIMHQLNNILCVHENGSSLTTFSDGFTKCEQIYLTLKLEIWFGGKQAPHYHHSNANHHSPTLTHCKCGPMLLRKIEKLPNRAKKTAFFCGSWWHFVTRWSTQSADA